MVRTPADFSHGSQASVADASSVSASTIKAGTGWGLGGWFQDQNHQGRSWWDDDDALEILGIRSRVSILFTAMDLLFGRFATEKLLPIQVLSEASAW